MENIYNERDGYVTGSEQQSQQPVDHFPACHEGYLQALIFFHMTKGGEHDLSSMRQLQLNHKILISATENESLTVLDLKTSHALVQETALS